MDEGKVFAISKFAKDLLEINDNLGMALEHVDMDKIKQSEDIDHLKVQLENIIKG